MTKSVLVGAVAYTTNVVPIWEGIRDYFADSPVETDFVLFSNYGRQVDALLDGTIDIAWNTNLAWVRTVLQTDGRCQALAMRDVDLDFRTVFATRAGAGLNDLADLRGRRVALGSRDSAQAAILPVQYLRDAGLGSDDVELIRLDSDLGKHGDTGRSELDAIRALLDEEADAVALGINTWEAIGQDELMPDALAELWRSPEYCHCNFTALDTLPDEVREPWVSHLLAMSWDDPRHRTIMELEGLRREWVLPNLEGYTSLFRAVEEQRIPARW
ncbi:phosphate/phosphite/phosphonate ABC transporter substrate-binding protein [Phytoactinopolyspora endophytica]|uniref:Rv1680 family SBP-like protein n=1 Tax=Phytoactinopolyspora endophytica TaxID=1642495 RepID=UPI00101D2492|nr:PhnD/SsuA/transferrin family substrate-binding protein [Phytoactinopolyspora endophytica]